MHDHARTPLARGFTLLELIVVLSILATISAAVVPIYGSSMQSLDIHNARRDFLAVLHFVQQRAVSESREYRLYINEDEGCYWAMYLAGVEDEEKVFEYAPTEFGERIYFPEHLHISRINAEKDRKRKAHYVACYPNGACERIKITFEDDRGRRRRFRVETHGYMGKIEVEDTRR